MLFPLRNTPCALLLTLLICGHVVTKAGANVCRTLGDVPQWLRRGSMPELRCRQAAGVGTPWAQLHADLLKQTCDTEMSLAPTTFIMWDFPPCHSPRESSPHWFSHCVQLVEVSHTRNTCSLAGPRRRNTSAALWAVSPRLTAAWSEQRCLHPVWRRRAQDRARTRGKHLNRRHSPTHPEKPPPTPPPLH